MFTTELFILEDSGERCPEYLNNSDAETGTDVDLGMVSTVAWGLLSNTTTVNDTAVECVSLSTSDYRDAFIQSVAELPVRHGRDM